MAFVSAPNIQLYTTPTCPDCRSLKGWLDTRSIPYTEHDLTDPTVADHAKSTYGVRVAPITVVDDTVLYGTFASQLPRLRQLLDGEVAV